MAEEKKKNNFTKPKISNINRNDIHIIGDNILYNNGIITAYYIVPLVNYSTASEGGIMSSIYNLSSIITNLYSNNAELTFTIERIEKKLKVRDVLNNLVDRIKIYREDFEMPIEFTKNIKDDIQEYCILGIDIQQSNLVEVEDLTIIDTAKALFKQGMNKLVGLGNMKMDPESILEQEKSIYRTIKDKVVRADKDFVFYNFVSKVYPCYILSYDKLSYINENSYEDIMCSVAQTVTDNFGWFEMHNEGVEIFGLDSQTTYGCMLDVKAFPTMIDSSNFPMPYPNTVTTIQCINKDKAKIDIKRIRASKTYEFEKGVEADADIETLERTQNSVNIATQALSEIEDGQIICQFNTSILVYGESREDLKQNIMRVVTSCKDRDILVAKSLTQALDFLDNYINKKPKKYQHMSNIMFPLSFQQNHGAAVGDDGSDPWSPAIGEDI